MRTDSAAAATAATTPTSGEPVAPRRGRGLAGLRLLWRPRRPSWPHLHYSIDVAGAYAVTFALFVLP